MKRWAVALLGLFGALPAHGTIITFITYFQTTSGGPAPAAPAIFVADTNLGVFTNFTVTWNGVTFDLTSSLNAPTIVGNGCPGEASTPTYGYMIMTQACPTATYEWSATTLSNGLSFFTFGESGDSIFGFGFVPGTPVASASGTWFATELPEPGTAEMLIGGGALLIGIGLIRRRRRPARAMRVSNHSPIRQSDG